MGAARWRLFETKTEATLRIEPFRRLTREEAADTKEEAGRLATFLAAETDVRIELDTRVATTA
jgi:histone H3/H4